MHDDDLRSITRRIKTKKHKDILDFSFTVKNKSILKTALHDGFYNYDKLDFQNIIERVIVRSVHA